MPAWDRGLGPSATYGPGGQPIAQIEPDGTTRWFHHDQLGSVRLTTNSTDGDQVAKRTFTAYGTADPTQSAGTQPILGYNAQQHDPETTEPRGVVGIEVWSSMCSACDGGLV